MQNLTEPDQKRIRQRLKDEFPHYAAKCLKIRTKSGKITSFTLNPVQEAVHEQAERQLAETGRIRALVLKARQPGVSTYVEGRFYWKVTHRKGARAFILTHSDQATSNLFAIAKRYHDNCPNPVRPEINRSNANELDFGLLDSGYRIGTAKAKGVGRSDTIQFFHGSEVAWWERADEHAKGALQAIPDEDGTEVWLETTANGVGGLFYNMWQAAERGESEYLPIFVPWFVHSEYVDEPADDWECPPDIAEYGRAHRLTRDQLYWCWRKNADLAAPDGLPTDELCWSFRQEYPATSSEAFRAAQTGSFIKSEYVVKARQAEMGRQDHGALVIGCDFARGNTDYNWFIDRQARRMGGHVNDRFHSDDTTEIAGKLARHIKRVRPQMCFLDTGGGGAQVYDILVQQGMGTQLRLVNFGGKPQDPRRYANKRAEMWGEMRDWLMDVGGAQIPDDDVLESEITAPRAKENHNNQWQLERKDDIRKRLHFSPDGGDAGALTFAEPVIKSDANDHDDGDDWDDRTRSDVTGY